MHMKTDILERKGDYWEVLWECFIPQIFIPNRSGEVYELHSLHSGFYIYFETENIKINISEW